MPLPDLALVEYVLAHAWRRGSHLHAESHWHAVTATGLDLADREPLADAGLVFLFGLLHDTRRESDGRDSGHGPRAAAFARDRSGPGSLTAGLDSPDSMPYPRRVVDTRSRR